VVLTNGPINGQDARWPHRQDGCATVRASDFLPIYSDAVL